MRVLIGLTFLCGLLLCSDPSVYVLSRLYEGAFFYWQYNYLDVEREDLYSRLSYGEKVVCVKEDFTEGMQECLIGEEPKAITLFSNRGNLKTFGIVIDGKEYIVKKHVQRGFFKNLFQMGKGVSIWNNLYWAKEKGIDVVEPVAFSEKRSLLCVKTVIVYRFEGEGLDHLAKEDMKSKLLFAIRQLKKRGVVHADLRPRNIVYTKGEDVVKFIDVDLMHFYPAYSYVCKKRLMKEEVWLQKDYEHLAL